MPASVVQRAATAARRWLFCALLAAFPGAVWADAAAGLEWLASQVLGSGQLASASGVASVAQSACETARTLLELSGPGAAATALTAALVSAAPAETATELLACTQWLQQQQNQIPRDTDLRSRRSAANGFAAYETQGSGSIIDSAWALQALAASWSSLQAEPTLLWLQEQQRPDGSFGIGTGSDLLATARVLRSLQDYRAHSGSAAAVADKAASYLLAQGAAAGHWQSDVGITALVFEAVHPYSGAEPNLALAVQTWLLAAQAPNGAWNGDDPWTTAVALRALAVARRSPVHPAQTALRIQFVDGQTGTPIAGVQLTGGGADSISASSDASGRLHIPGLAPGAYTLSAAAAGYSNTQISATLQRGQTTDLGVVHMLPPANSTTVVVHGTVRDSASGEPVSGATIAVLGQTLTATTDGAGRYLIGAVPPGAIGLRASKTGYLDASGQASAQAGQTLNFSPSLVRSAAAAPACQIIGTITKAADHSPIAGATVTLSGANTGSATTDSAGAYALTGLVSGAVTISAGLTGYDTALAHTRIHCSPQRNTALQYSPTLYASNQGPADANSAGLSGIVLDARNNQPIANAQLTFTTDSAIVRHTRSQTDGRFSVTGLDGATAQLVITASGYQTITLGYALQPAQNIDLGQIRLRPPQLTQLTLDLQVQSVKRHTRQTDAQTLQLSGAIEVQVRNAGTLAAPADVPLLAFLDGNANGVYDEGADSVLGQALLGTALGPGQSDNVTLDVAGLLPFRDAPIHVVLDPSGALVESDKHNNILSTSAVKAIEEFSDVTPTLKWRWSSSRKYPWSVGVMTVPLVVPLFDTNGDGKVDASDERNVVFVSFSDWFYNGPLRIVSGKTGAEIYTSDSMFAGLVSPAVADIDGDGHPEIVALESSGTVAALNADGSVKWRTRETFPVTGSGVWGAITIADIDSDGQAEIFLGNRVFTSTGHLKWVAPTRNFGGNFYPFNAIPYSVPVVAEINGRQALLLGASATDATGQLIWENREVGDGIVAVADMNLDGTPEIVVIAPSALFILDANGRNIVGPVSLPGTANGSGGAPTIADFDGDRVPDIGIALTHYYCAYRADGSMIWCKPTRDISEHTGSTSFDFNGDGVAEVIYQDELVFRIYAGPDGTELFSASSHSWTGAEYPVVADVDRDGAADILVPNSVFSSSYYSGITVYSGAGKGWVPTRGIWNQHAYSITNINDDLSVPRNPVPSWKSHNSFRLNRRMDADPRAIADLTASYVRVHDTGSAPGSQIVVRLGNAGSYKVPAGTPVALYNTDPGLKQPAASALLARGVTQTLLETGAWEDLALTPALALDQLSAQGNVWIVADDDGSGGHTLPDFDRSNNTVLADLGAIARNLHIAVRTDKAVYAETDLAHFTATVRNAGSFARDALVRFTVQDAAGQLVDVLPLGPEIGIQPGASGQTQAPWSVAAVLAGDYSVRAELISAQGLVYGSASAAFAVQATNADGAGLNSTRISTDRSQYDTASSVLIDSRVANLSSNQLQQNLQAITEVTAPDGRLVLSRTEAIAQAVPRSQRQYRYRLPAGTLQPGNYQARLQLLSTAASARAETAGTSPAGNLLAQSRTSFSVQATAQTGIGISGQLSANPQVVPLGSVTSLQLDVTNRGDTAIGGATIRVRVLDAESAAALATFTQTGVQLAIGASASWSWGWTACCGTAGATLPVAATVELAGSARETALAQTTVQLSAAAAQPAQPTQQPRQRLTGTLAATPKSVPAGAAVQLNYRAHNPGPHSVSASFALSIRASGESAVLAHWDLPAQTLGAGSQFIGNQSWSPPGAAGSHYEASWSATVDGHSSVLASDRFAVDAPGAPDADLGVQIGDGADPRPLVLVSCSSADDGQAHNPACDQAKAQALRSWFSAHKLAATVVTSRAEFETGMRCGNFNVYWISGGADKLGDGAVQELREALERGAGLLVDGAPAARDAILQRALGISAQGSSGQSNPVAQLSGTIWDGPIALPTQGTPVRYSVHGATVHGSLSGGAPAALSRTLGKGRGLVLAFNLASLLAQARPGANDELAAVLTAGLHYLSQPVSHSGVPDAPHSLVTELHNRSAETVAIDLQALLPAGVRFLAASPGPDGSDPLQHNPLPNAESAQDWRWRMQLPPRATTKLFLYVSAANPGRYSLPLHISRRSAAVNAAAPASTQTLTHSLTIRAAQTLADDAKQTLAALQPTAAADAHAAAAAYSAAGNAAARMAQGEHAQSLAHWIDAANALRSLGSGIGEYSAATARLAVAQALQAAQRQLCRQWACISGALDFRRNGQPSHQVPLHESIVGRSLVVNHCAAPIADLPVTTLWVNRRSSATVHQFSEPLNIAGHQSARRDTDWNAQGQHGDSIDITLTAHWLDQLLHLDRDVLLIGAPLQQRSTAPTTRGDLLQRTPGQ